MKKNKKFQNFNENLEKISEYLNNLLKKGGDFAQDVWDATKRESQETKIAVEILRRMIRGEEVSNGEKQFVRKQSGDVVRILPLVAISGLPIPVPIVPLLIVLGKKYGFDFLPKDHRGLLDNKIELSEEIRTQLESITESGPGYQIVDLILKNGRILSDRKIINCCYLILNPFEEITADQIEDIIK